MDIDNPNREHDHESDLTALAHRLAAWRPTAGALDRDRMLYDAGRAAARAESHLQSWRLATAALIVVAIGLGGLSARERSLLTHERSQRHALETALAARVGASEPSSPAPLSVAETSTIEPLSPTSYFALTSRLAKSVRDLSSPDFEIDSESHRPALGHSETLPYPVPLRPQDLQRIRDL